MANELHKFNTKCSKQFITVNSSVMFKIKLPTNICRMATTQVFVCSLKYVNYENYEQLSAKLHLISLQLASCFLTTFVFNLHFACLFALSVALGFQISLLVACFLDICRLSKYLTNTTMSFLQNSGLFF